jgi:hypothetical protein
VTKWCSGDIAAALALPFICHGETLNYNDERNTPVAPQWFSSFLVDDK